MIKQDPWFLEERAFAIASLLLTKRRDAIVRAHSGTDMAVDLLVEILKDGKSSLRFFGVQLIEYLDLPNPCDANERVHSHFPAKLFEAPFPICIFVIGVRVPRGLYRWVVAPVVDNGRALLQRDVEQNWQTLDDAGVGRLIDQVNGWYDALNQASTPTPQGRRAKAES